METALINHGDDEEKREVEEEEEEEEEALSLCDLPVNLIKEENQVQARIDINKDGKSQTIETEEDFNFGSWGGSLPTEPAEMCVADEVFFKGQILPLRLSVSSDSGLQAGFRIDSRNTSRCMSRSESMDHRSLSRFSSISSNSRSSSTRSSHYSTSSSNSLIVTARNFDYSSSKSKPIKTRNNFNTHPSPKPQIRLSKTRPVNACSNRNQKSSSMWEFFRLGLVRAPELELQDLKVRSHNNNIANRNSVSRNSSCNSSNSSSSTGKTVNQQDTNKGFLEKKINGLFNGCKCSVNAVETVPLNDIVVIKNNTNRNNEKLEKAMLYAATEEKKKKLLLMQEQLKTKKKTKEKEKGKQEGKQALSRHRTFEWLKELSHASYVDEA